MARVLLVSIDAVGTTMAGPGIRYWEIARSLAPLHEVTLLCPNDPDVSAPGVKILSAASSRWPALLAQSDVLITQRLRPGVVAAARRHGVRIILDAYDPILLELLEVHASRPASLQRKDNRRARAETLFGMQAADAVICAGSRQRDLWLGVLMAVDRITPELYSGDPTLRSLIDVVPFGLPEQPAVRTGPGFRQQLALSPDRTVLIWGGGIWNWFDPLTLLRAVASVARRRDDIALVFMGTERPHAHRVPEMAMAARARALSDELGLTGRHVFFNAGWVPYAERQNHLLDADIGVSTHFDHVETRFAFRTRVLDYLWAGLPVVATEGDVQSDLIATQGWGRVARAGDVEALTRAVEGLLENGALVAARAAIAVARPDHTWSRAVQPLLRLIDSVLAQPPQPLSAATLRSVAQLYRGSAEMVHAEAGARGLALRVGERLQRRGGTAP